MAPSGLPWWQADSQPLRHQGIPSFYLFNMLLDNLKWHICPSFVSCVIFILDSTPVVCLFLFISMVPALAQAFIVSQWRFCKSLHTSLSASVLTFLQPCFQSGQNDLLNCNPVMLTQIVWYCSMDHHCLNSILPYLKPFLMSLTPSFHPRVLLAPEIHQDFPRVWACLVLSESIFTSSTFIFCTYLCASKAPAV